MQRFTDIKAWQRSQALVLRLYRLTSSFPFSERFGLVAQLRRAAVSVPTNIAEGSRRRTGHDYARFLNVAEGSLAEAESLLLLSRDLGFAAIDEIEPLLNEAAMVCRMIYLLRLKVEDSTTRNA